MALVSLQVVEWRYCFRRTVSQYADSGQSYRPGRVKHPTIELAEIARERYVKFDIFAVLCAAN